MPVLLLLGACIFHITYYLDKVHPILISYYLDLSRVGILLPNEQRQHRTLHIQKDVLP